MGNGEKPGMTVESRRVGSAPPAEGGPGADPEFESAASGNSSRGEFGKGLRKVIPRQEHARWEPVQGRPSPVDVITSQNGRRLDWLVPVRHWRMSQSPFTFYRGAAKLMAFDLAGTPVSGITAQICGDAHLSNFGFYGSPERALVFDLNDFDETLPGPWEWDVKRLAASFAIAARHNRLTASDQEALAEASVEAYRMSMRESAHMGYLDIWYSRQDEATLEGTFGGLLTTKQLKSFRKYVEKTRSKGSRNALGRLAEPTGSGYQIVSQPPLIIPLRDLQRVRDTDFWQKALTHAITQYLESVPDHIEALLRRYSVVDFAVKVVGVGSVGTRCFIVLAKGRDASDPLFLQVKEATRSVLEDHLPASRYESAGRRVVEGQRLMQAVSDIFLGWSSQTDDVEHHFYWRQLKDMKGSADVEGMDREGMLRYAKLCGWTLARAHSRSADPAEISGYLGASDSFDSAVAKFAVRYADQNDADYEVFSAAASAGDIPVQSDSDANRAWAVTG